LARVSHALPPVGDKALDLLDAAKNRISAEINGQNGNDERAARERREHELEENRRKEQIIFKAREIIFTWAEGFEHYEDRFPLFAQTYQMLINEGIDFGDVTLHTPAILETPKNCVKIHERVHVSSPIVHNDAAAAEEEAIAQAIRASMEDMNGAVEAGEPISMTDQAHQSAKMLVDVKDRQACSGDEEEQQLLHELIQDCTTQQRQMAGAVEASIQSGQDDVLMNLLAANEALQQALLMPVTEALENVEEDEKEDIGIKDIVEYLNEHAEQEEEKEEQKEVVDVEAHFLQLDFNDTGKYSVKSQEVEEANLENSQAPSTSPILPDL
jgi:hypothetical protein